ncbi:MAG TPA: phosphatidate cytidylyltransferase [Gemmatimonadaceae bacterium]
MSELTRRVLVGVIAAPLGVLIVFSGGWALAALLAILSALGAWEYFRIARASGLTPLEDVGIPLAGVVPLFVHARYLQLYELPLSGMALAVLGILTLALFVRGVEGRPLGAAASTVFGVLYTGGMLSFGYAIRYHPYVIESVRVPLGGLAVTAGGLLLLLPLLLTWASDIGAYFVGRAFGKRKLMPTVSPGKTVAGAVGGLLATMLVGWLYARFVLTPSTQLAFVRGGILVFAILVSIAAQIGDLAESLLKREAGVKDSSHIIPGHGGILDRFDSLLFVLPVAYVLFNTLLVWAPPR